MSAHTWYLVPLAFLGCSDSGSIKADRFTVHAPAYATDPQASACVVVADLVSTRDSSNVDLTIKACAGSTCSLPSHQGVPEGPFVPGRAKTIEYELERCPSQPDRILVDVSRWGSMNMGIGGNGVVTRFEKTPGDDGRCSVAASLRVQNQVTRSLAFLVARDSEARPLARTIPFNVAEPQVVTEAFSVACELIASMELQVVL
jgi:hypothetical protein